jgi:hypothetical protein
MHTDLSPTSHHSYEEATRFPVTSRFLDVKRKVFEVPFTRLLGAFYPSSRRALKPSMHAGLLSTREPRDSTRLMLTSKSWQYLV